MKYSLIIFEALNIFVFVFCDEYRERVDIFHLKNNDLAAKFVFTTSRPLLQKNSRNNNEGNVSNCDHYHLFPKIIGLMVKKYKLNEFHLSLSQGFWNSRQWGEQLAQISAPMGAQILAWFLPDVTNPDENWRNFVNSLSGFFCASFSQIETKLSVSPEVSFRPEGAVKFKRVNNTLCRYGVLPSENVCTENLTPWKKLLPCKSARGISNLLSTLKIFDSPYASLMIDVRRICKDEKCASVDLELTQTIAIVLSSTINRQGFSLSKLFRAYVKQPCVLAKESLVLLNLPTFYEPSFSPNVSNTKILENGKLLRAVFSLEEILKSKNYADIEIKYAKAPGRFEDNQILPPLISVHSYLTGSGQFNGGLATILVNSAEIPIKIVYSHLVPWLLRIYLHSLTIACDGRPIKPERIMYQAARLREKPHYLEVIFTLPPRSSCRLMLNCEKMLLRWTEYPPDAHHGFFIPAASVSYRINDSKHCAAFDLNCSSISGVRRISGEVLLINLPTPDFSMPYNVICLVCTVLALAFGPIYNLTTRNLVIKSEDDIKEKSIASRLKRGFLAARIRVLRRPIVFFIVLVTYLLFLCLILPICFCFISCDVFCRHYGFGIFCSFKY